MSDDILQHIPALRAYSRSLCKALPDAEDLVQDTLLRAIEHARQYRPGTNMRAWLFTIMRNRFLTNCRRAGRERTGAADCVSGQVQVTAGQEWHLRALETQAALHRMPACYREAVVLVGALGASYAEAAQLMGCDLGTVKSRVSRARAILRQENEAA